MSARIIEVRKGVLKKNDLLAHDLRQRFEKAGVFVVNLVSSPGSGKTRFLERTLESLVGEIRVAALVGDLATDNDAERLAATGAQVKQITTGTICHLDAEMIDKSLAGWNLEDLDVLFIENVGNLVCPSSYDLGENVRVLLHSVTEGEDKPLKYPTIYNTADLVIITKADIAEAVEFDGEATRRNVETMRPGIEVMTSSAKTGEGIAEWIGKLRQMAGLGSAVAG